MENDGSVVEYEIPRVVELDHVVRIIYTTLFRSKPLCYFVYRYAQEFFRFGVYVKPGQNLSKPVACLPERPGNDGFHASQHFLYTWKTVCTLPSLTSSPSPNARENVKYLCSVTFSTRSRHVSSSKRPGQLAMHLRWQMFAVRLFVWRSSAWRYCSFIASWWRRRPVD